MKQLIEVMAEYSLYPIDLVADGKLNRFAASPDDKKKSGWAFVWQNHTLKSGEPYYTAVFGNHRTGDHVNYHDENVKFSREDKKNIREQAEKARKLAQEQKEKYQRDAAAEAKIIFEQMADYGDSEYLRGKKIPIGLIWALSFSRGDLLFP